MTAGSRSRTDTDRVRTSRLRCRGPLAVSLGVAAALVAPSVPGAAHTAGSCQLDRAEDRCEKWTDLYDDRSIRPPRRSDQFVTATGANQDTVFVALKNVALDPDDPYAATGSWMVIAYDADSGEHRWVAERSSRAYDMPLDMAVSPDGESIYVTGAAYDAFSVTATDSRVVTVAYDADSGAERWSGVWDNRPDGTDNGKVVDVSADGSEVYVGGVTTTPRGDLDYVVLAYDARHGREKWSATYDGRVEGGTDALSAIAADPAGRYVYVTGSSATEHEFDLDYTTLAIRAGHGRPGSVGWIARYDGAGEHKPDRPGALGVSPDGSTVVVTGNSYAPGPDGSTGYDAVTVGYSPSGDQLWEAAYGGPGAGVAYDGGRAVAVTDGVAVITAQSAGATQDDGLDAATVAYNLTTGGQLWVHREDQPRSSELPKAIAVSPDGSIAYVASSAHPVVPYTSLDELVLHAYRIGDGAEAWTTRLDAGAGNAVTPDALAVTPAGEVVVAGLVIRSQSPVGPPSQNRYDAVTSLFTPRSVP